MLAYSLVSAAGGTPNRPIIITFTLTTLPTLSPIVVPVSAVRPSTGNEDITSRGPLALPNLTRNGPSCRCVAAVAPQPCVALNPEQMRSSKSFSTKSTTPLHLYSYADASIRSRETPMSGLTTSSRDMDLPKPFFGRWAGAHLLLSKSST